MKSFLLLSVFFLVHTTFCFGQQKSQQTDLYAIAKLPTPVLNTPDFSFVFGTKMEKLFIWMMLDYCGKWSSSLFQKQSSRLRRPLTRNGGLLYTR